MAPLESLREGLNLVWLAILFPFYLCETLVRERRDSSPLGSRWVNKRRAEYAPIPLPKRRPRKLSFSGSPNFLFKDRKQIQCLLFKLPLEIRQAIYGYVLMDGDPLIHINQSLKKLNYRRCSNPSRVQTCTSCRACFTPILPGLRGYYNGEDPDTYVRSDGGILPLLRSCRQIYSESIALVVYTQHTFSFAGFEPFLYFTRAIIPERLNAIRSSVIEGLVLPSPHSTDLFPHDFKTWKQAWSVIATMNGLKNLKIIIEPSHGTYYDAEEKAIIFAPLKEIRQVLEYEVFLNWERQSYDVYPESDLYRITGPVATNSKSQAAILPVDAMISHD